MKYLCFPRKNGKHIGSSLFTVENVRAFFIYQRRVETEKIKIIQIRDPFRKGKFNNVPILPLDDLDEFLLNGVKEIDQNATIENKMFIINTGEEYFLRPYEGLPKYQFTLIALPSFDDHSVDELIHLEGQKYTRYCLFYPLRTIGSLSTEKELSLTTYYDISEREDMETLMKRLDAEVILL